LEAPEEHWQVEDAGGAIRFEFLCELAAIAVEILKSAIAGRVGRQTRIGRIST
jgi:hypothetical protein